MQLKYNKTIAKNVITIELETANFSPDENKMLDEFGEPVISVEKIYATSFPVQFSKKIRTGFKLKVKFDGTENIAGAAEAANLFFEEIQELLGSAMASLSDKSSDADFEVGNGILQLKY